jgi:two-component system, OmpR family, sensor histidine kinase CiaH
MMFARARIRLTLLYAALLGATVVLVAGAIGFLAVQEARRTDDRELQIRASAIAAALPEGPPREPSGPPPSGLGPGPPRLEQEGLLEYLMPVVNGAALPPPFGGLTGLPNLDAGQRAIQSAAGHYETVTIEGSQVRVYSLPVLRSDRIVALVQVVRSRYFVDSAVSRIALIALIAGSLGVVTSGGAGYWLAGRTLRPIALALERQRNFAADASHELRSPLTVMLTNAELLTLHPERSLADYHDVVTDIIAETERLSRLVSDLLTLARADQGQIESARARVSLTDVAQTVVRRFAPLAASKGLALNEEIQTGLVVEGDSDRLLQLAVILVDNAVRYTARGSIKIRVGQRGNEAILEVSDTGPGIAAEHLPHLFERFYRTDSARSAEEGGSGLGLALAQWIAQSHRSRIEVSSTVGHGSTFMIRLPLSRAATRARTPNAPIAGPT